MGRLQRAGDRIKTFVTEDLLCCIPRRKRCIQIGRPTNFRHVTGVSRQYHVYIHEAGHRGDENLTKWLLEKSQAAGQEGHIDKSSAERLDDTSNSSSEIVSLQSKAGAEHGGGNGNDARGQDSTLLD